MTAQAQARRPWPQMRSVSPAHTKPRAAATHQHAYDLRRRCGLLPHPLAADASGTQGHTAALGLPICSRRQLVLPGQARHHLCPVPTACVPVSARLPTQELSSLAQMCGVLLCSHPGLRCDSASNPWAPGFPRGQGQHASQGPGNVYRSVSRSGVRLPWVSAKGPALQDRSRSCPVSADLTSGQSRDLHALLATGHLWPGSPMQVGPPTACCAGSAAGGRSSRTHVASHLRPAEL